MTSKFLFKIIRKIISSLNAFCKSVDQAIPTRVLFNPDENKSRGFLGKYSSFLLKFLFFSTILYILWIPVASAYFSVILKITAIYFELIEIAMPLSPSQDFLYSQGIHSSIPPFIALMLATNLYLEKKALLSKNIKKIFSNFFSLQFFFPPKIFLKKTIVGILILFTFRVILQISYVYLLIPPTGEFYSLFVIFLSGTFRVALPFLLWFALLYKKLFPLSRTEKDMHLYICPFCCAEKIGILNHIKDAHGEEALKSEEVKKLI